MRLHSTPMPENEAPAMLNAQFFILNLHVSFPCGCAAP
jgi:hypothetical protein